MHLNPEIAALLNGLNNPSLPGIDLSLERMDALLEALGNPQLKLPAVVHIAGTNGKGSTLAFMRAIYSAQGYRVHAYTSPHLVRFNERILLAGHEITDAQLLPILERIAAVATNIPVTFFEATTAAAFVAFAENPADVVLLETGLGGRLDATNVIAAPALTVITPVDFDHMEFLGDSIAAIAAEKAGIIKPQVRCAVGAQAPEAMQVIMQQAEALDAPCVAHNIVWKYTVTEEGIRVQQGRESWHIPKPAMLGQHQHHNAALASVAVKNCAALPVGEAALSAGILAARWPARLQPLTSGPLVAAWGSRGAVVLDGAHNASAARALMQWLEAEQKPVTLLLGMMRRKDPVAFLTPLAPYLRAVIAMPIAGEDCQSPELLVQAAKTLGINKADSVNSAEELPALFAAEEAGTLLIAGSLFLAGELLKKHG